MSYCHIEPGLVPVSGRGIMHDQTLAGEIGLIFAKIQSTVAHKR